MNYSHALIIAALVAYALAAGLYLHAFPKPNERSLFARSGLGAFIFATLTMTAVILTSQTYGYYTMLSGLILVAAISWVTLISVFLFRTKTLPTFVAPFATFMILLQFFTAPQHVHVVTQEKSFLAGFHIFCALLGEAFAIVACGISVLYLNQQRALKRKQLALITSATPPIDRLDRIHAIILWAGFAFISVGLITGAIYAQFYVPNLGSSLQAKIIWAFAVWFWYLVTLLARNIFNFSGKRIALMSLIGFLLLSLALFGLGVGGLA